MKMLKYDEDQMSKADRSRPILDEVNRLDEMMERLCKACAVLEDVLHPVLRPRNPNPHLTTNGISTTADQTLVRQYSELTERLSHMAEKFGNVIANLNEMADRVEV
jgi:hypothetical protein